jgi:hypothetical protein
MRECVSEVLREVRQQLDFRPANDRERRMQRVLNRVIDDHPVRCRRGAVRRVLRAHCRG